MLHQGRDAIITISIPLLDMVCFAVIFGLAVFWRKKLEYHRRLMLIASCTLTAAAWERLPESVLPGFRFYAGVDLLIMMGVTRDLLVKRKIHRVYLIAAATVHGRTLRSRSEGRCQWRRGTVLVTSPTDSLRMLRIEHFRFRRVNC